MGEKLHQWFENHFGFSRCGHLLISVWYGLSNRPICARRRQQEENVMDDPPPGTSRHATTTRKQERTFDEWSIAFLPLHAFADCRRILNLQICDLQLSLPICRRCAILDPFWLLPPGILSIFVSVQLHIAPTRQR